MKRNLSDEEANFLGRRINKKFDGKKNATYTLKDHEWEKIQDLRNKGVLNSCTNLEVDPTTVKHLWKKTKNESVFVKNPLFVEQQEKSFDDILKDFDNRINTIVEKSVKRSKIEPKTIKTSFLFDVAVYTDVHTAMNPNPNGFSLYGGKWDAEEIDSRNDIFVSKVLENKKANKLIIFDLGDLMDGWDGQTVRKGHELPQNMSNEEAFDVALDFKIKQIDLLAKDYEEIEIININDDNHSGAFSYVVNSAFKRFIEQRYSNVKVINQRKFIDHYIYGNKVFVATHGKDGKNLKFGFKPKLDPIQIEKIDNYLAENDLIRKNLEVYFIKGDSHQDIFDNSTAQNFKYWNFPAFSPSSNWVQTNFKKGVSGFYTFNFEENTYHPHPYYFKWK